MKTQITPNFENIATPGAIVRQLEGRTMPELIALFRRAESATVRGWMLMSCIVGVARRRARYGEGAAGKLAAEIGCSERSVHRLAELFSELIHQRIETEGDRAQFPLAEQAFYLLAVENAAAVGKSPIARLQHAGQARASNPQDTVAKCRREVLGDDAAIERRSPRLLLLVKKLAGASEAAVQELATGAAGEDVSATLDAAIAKLNDIRRALRRPRAA